MEIIKRIPQRTMDDCVTCVLAMITGYGYERVQEDGQRYPQQTSDGRYYEWWVDYLRHQGFTIELRPFMGAYDLWKDDGRTVGILGMTIPHLKRRHVAAVDQAGVIDPADGSPDHIHLADYIQSRLPQGVVFDADFLALLRR